MWALPGLLVTIVVVGVIGGGYCWPSSCWSC